MVTGNTAAQAQVNLFLKLEDEVQFMFSSECLIINLIMNHELTKYCETFLAFSVLSLYRM